MSWISGKKAKVPKELTVGELIECLQECDPNALIRIHEKESGWDFPARTVQKDWRGETGKVFILGGR